MAKRKKPDEMEWADVDIENLNLKDLKTLLQNRSMSNIPHRREDMEKMLKGCDVEIECQDWMTAKQLQAELRLRGLDDSNAKKVIYLKRLRGEVAAPALKKIKKGAKKKKNIELLVLKYMWRSFKKKPKIKMTTRPLKSRYWEFLHLKVLLMIVF